MYSKTLKEGMLRLPNGQEDYDRLLEIAGGQRFFQKVLKEATLEGDITDETDVTDALGVVYDQIIMGAQEHIPLDFARVFRTDKSEINVPIGTYGVATALSGGAFTDAPKSQVAITMAIDEEWGHLVTWTRAHLEDAVWDVMAEQIQGVGYGIQLALCDLLVTGLEAVTAGTQARGAEIAHDGIESPAGTFDGMTWAQFLNLVSSLDIAGTGPCTHVLVTPYDYWALLKEDKFISSLYAGSDEVMRSGIAKTMFGVTVLKVSGLTGSVALGSTTNHAIAVNANKSIGLAYRRDITIEPFENPDTNKYGFVASVRAVADVLVPAAVQVSVGSVVA